MNTNSCCLACADLLAGQKTNVPHRELQMFWHRNLGHVTCDLYHCRMCNAEMAWQCGQAGGRWYLCNTEPLVFAPDIATTSRPAVTRPATMPLPAPKTKGNDHARMQHL